MLLHGRIGGGFPETTMEKGDTHMFYIKATAIQLIDDSAYPEIVRCVFMDSHGRTHTVTEKWPVVSAEKFKNSFPKDCTLGCVVLERRGEVCVVDTERPWCIESEEGETVFEIHEDLLMEGDE